jgi:ketosteroid isomerase-like protein
MSQENLEAFRRSIEAANRRDLDGLLEELDPAVEWHAGLFELLGGEATVYRGREGARQAVRELLEAFPDFQLDISEARALGDRVLGIGRIHAHGAASGVEVDSFYAYLVRFKDGKGIWVRSFIHPQHLEAAGLWE